MWWLVTLLIFAAITFFVVKSMKSSTLKQQTEHELELDQQARLDASPVSQSQPSTQGTAQTAVDAADKTAPNDADTGGSMAGDTVSAATGASTAAATGAAAGVAVAAAAVTAASSAVSAGLDSGDTLADIREMIKILNLDAPDAGRLQISREQMTALRKGEQSGLPDTAALGEVATRLRRMLA